jgi:RNA recognition motif-containing protein
MNIYVGNLSFNTTDDQLRQAFESFGEVKSVAIITDKFTGESRGFAFVEMPEKSAAIAAISGMNGQELNGRTLNVNEARPRTEGGGGGGRGGGGVTVAVAARRRRLSWRRRWYAGSNPSDKKCSLRHNGDRLRRSLFCVRLVGVEPALTRSGVLVARPFVLPRFRRGTKLSEASGGWPTCHDHSQ